MDRLLDVALGTYDLDLVLFVAEKSHRDPRELLPLLNELKRLPEPMRKFRIDLKLRRLVGALEHAAGWQEGLEQEELKDECVKVVVDNRLYKEALKIFAKREHILEVVKDGTFLEIYFTLSNNFYILIFRLFLKNMGVISCPRSTLMRQP